MCSDTYLLSCSCMQLTLSCQILPHQCVLTIPSCHVLVYSWHCLAKNFRISVLWILPLPLFLNTTDMVLPSSAASVCSDSSLEHCFGIQVSVSCQELPHQCVLTPPSSPVLVYSWHCLAKYCRISVFWLVPPPLFLYTTDSVLRRAVASVCSDSSLIHCSCVQLTFSCRISVFWILPPPLLMYTADMFLASTAASVCSDSFLLPCSCIQLTLSCQVLPHKCFMTLSSSPVLVYNRHGINKFCRIIVFWHLSPTLSLYTADIVLPSTATSVCSDSSLPCSCIQLALSFQVLPHQCVLTPPSTVLPRTVASLCSDSSLLPYSCIQLTKYWQVLPHQCVLNPHSSPVLV